MKHVFKSLSLTLIAASLLLTACTKKPVRPNPGNTTTGGDTGLIDPNTPAVQVDPSGTLEQRDTGTPEGTSVVDPIYFALDRFAVAAEERPKLQNVIKWLADNPGKNLVLVGHCDWRGTAEYNLGLGDRRAASVKRYLQSLGADASRLETLSKGSTEAKQGGGDAEWKKDRRVDFVELKKQ
jgi:peptidoglycan-associated lipoprotein